jgi:hypothetical protein
MASRSSKSDSPVAAEEQLAQARGETGEEGTPLEKQAKEQKAQQAEELASGKGAGSDEKDKLVKKGLVAAARRQPGTPVNQAKMDNLSVRSGADALEGHFVTLDVRRRWRQGEAEVGRARQRRRRGRQQRRAVHLPRAG